MPAAARTTYSDREPPRARLRQFREALGLTQAEFGLKLKLTGQSVRLIEKGRRGPGLTPGTVLHAWTVVYKNDPRFAGIDLPIYPEEWTG